MLPRPLRLPLAFCVASAIALPLALGPATAQPARPTQAGVRHALGEIPESAETLAALPHIPLHRAFLPVRVDLSRFFPSPGDQGAQSSCVGWAVGYAARAYYAIAHDGRTPGDPSVPSPAYIYNSITKSPGSCDRGSRVTDALALLVSAGSLSLADYPYDDRSCLRPSIQQRNSAVDFRIANYRVNEPIDLDTVKGALAGQHGNPVIVSWLVYENFTRLQANETYRGPAGPKQGYHAITVVGYDEERQAFKLINSWGRDWADGGSDG